MLNEFPKLKGRIPLKGSIEELECDNEGNLVVVCHDNEQRNSLLSIYRIRK